MAQWKRRLQGPSSLSLVAAFAATWIFCGGLLGQPPHPARNPSVGGLQPLLPTMPQSLPRPGQGTGPDERWQLEPQAAGRKPVASFLESIKGTDAAVELTLGQGKVLTLKQPIASEAGVAMIALGDPAVVDFEVMPNPRMFRLLGKSPGVTDLTITTADGQTFGLEIHVTYDLLLITTHLRQLFPDAYIKLSQLREHVVVEGQARSPQEIAQIIETLQAYIASMAPPILRGGGGRMSSADLAVAAQQRRRPDERALEEAPTEEGDYVGPTNAVEEQNRDDWGLAIETGRRSTSVRAGSARIINLMRVPGVQQVLLQVKIAELDRIALREIGADLFYAGSGGLFGTQISNAVVTLLGLAPGGTTTAFAVFPNSEFDFMLQALRRNAIVSILAEPNLVAMHGQEASFLSGGEFPVPVQQSNTGAISIQFKEFGTQLYFVPYILDDETIRLSVAPEVSTIDETIGVGLPGSTGLVPGVITRRLSTVVELKEGQTLALAGLLQSERESQTDRIPLVGDLPYIGRLFSDSSHRRTERELLVLVTPHLVRPMDPCQVGPVPGDDVTDPNDLEFYLLGRLEGRTGRPHRPTTSWDNPLHMVEFMKLESKGVVGPVGFSHQ